MPPVLQIYRMGRLGYSAAEALQRQLVARRQADQGEDCLLLLEHDPVVTYGRRAGTTHLRASPAELAELGIALAATDRGGDITYHGPGQLIGYLILRLTPGEQDIPLLFQRVEVAICQVLSSYGLDARGGTEPRGGTGHVGLGQARAELGQAGVWLGNSKICALGMRVSRWVTKHGFALNVAPRLQHFETIVPCGLIGKRVTSLAEQLGRAIPVAELEHPVGLAIARALERTPAWCAQEQLAG